MSTKKKCTLIASTRDYEDAEVLADRIAVLHKGSVRSTGSPGFLKRALGNYTHHVSNAYTAIQSLRTVPNSAFINIKNIANPSLAVMRDRMPQSFTKKSTISVAKTLKVSSEQARALKKC